MKIDERHLRQIRTRYEEYNPDGGSKYKAFLYSAHEDVGFLLDAVDWALSRVEALESERIA